MIETAEDGKTFYVDPDTGARKEVKLARFDLVPPEAELALAEHFGRGALKYADRNWERGLPFSVLIASLQRHLNAWKGGEELDQEGFRHLDAVMWHAACLITFTERGRTDLDDRPSTVGLGDSAPSHEQPEAEQVQQ